MRQIYLLASEADETAAAEVATLLQQRGYMVRRADEKLAYPPARRGEVTVALWSKAVQFSSKQILFTNRAIDAWTEGRLVLARLDHVLHPRGLGDVPAIDLSFAPGRMAAIWKVVEAVQEIDREQEIRRRESSGGGESDEAGGDEADLAVREEAPGRGVKAKKMARQSSFSIVRALIVGLVVAAALGSAGFLALPLESRLLLGAAALAGGALVGLIAGFVNLPGASAKRATRAPAAAPAPQPPMAEAPPGSDSVFVSYARSNSGIVYPLVAEVEAAGRDVWIDRDGIEAGTNWAGTIVRAIRESNTFCLMCSAEAFQSDNVRREIYIADKYKRKLLPVRLDSSELPEDFEYFLIDRQWLDLTAAEPQERAERLKAALAR